VLPLPSPCSKEFASITTALLLRCIGIYALVLLLHIIQVSHAHLRNARHSSLVNNKHNGNNCISVGQISTETCQLVKFRVQFTCWSGAVLLSSIVKQLCRCNACTLESGNVSRSSLRSSYAPAQMHSGEKFINILELALPDTLCA